ncbi:MAG: Crp/Fnr family transcriptional regulator [Bacteroidia bacterium]
MEIAQELKAAFDQFFEAPIDAWKGFASVCELIEFRKNTVLKHENEAEHFMYFILQGSAGVFLFKDEHFVCLDIAHENHFFCDMMSLLSNTVTPLQTMMLEDSKVLRLTKEDYLKLGETEIGMVLTKTAAESSFIHKQQQQIDLLTKTAEQRYKEFISNNPGLVNRISQKHIASYLGITPQSFSRLKKNK